MQSGHESAEIYQQRKQFTGDDCCSSAFSISNPHKQNHPHHNLHHYQQQLLFQQLHQIPTTQQLFQHQHPQFEAFRDHQQQQQQRRLDRQLGLEGEPGREPVGNSFFNVNFKLGLNENSGNREGVLNQDEDEALLRGSEHHIPETESRPNSLVMPQCWQPQEHSTIKEPFWKPLNGELFNRNNKRCNEEEEEKEREGIYRNKYSKSSEQVNGNDRGKNLENKYRLFGELEAIYSCAGIGESNQTGSGSALTGENSPTNACLLTPFSDPYSFNVATAEAATAAIGVDHGSETSIGEEASLRKIRKKRRRRKMKEQLSSMAGFFESLVKQLVDHQEGLHRKFLGVVEKLDQEWIEREEEWRRQQAAKFNREAIARAHEQALASSREAAIVSYLEKITGQSINLHISKTQLQLQSEIPLEPINELIQPMEMDNNVIDNTNINTNNRWPKAAVEALIRVRSSLESRFQEPGLKGPLWEEISSSMTSMGYERSAKRCKEKWENINKYFKKTKDNARKRPQQSKTCPYFDQLAQLYSRSFIDGPSSSYCYKPSVASDVEVQTKSNSELLDAIIVGSNLGTTQNLSMENFEVAEMGYLKLDFDGFADKKVELHQGSHGKEKEYRGFEDTDEDVEDNEEEEGGDDDDECDEERE